jgi:hypothetical protein
MAGTWTAGHSIPIKFTPDTFTEVTLNVTDSTWQERIDEIDITHTGTAGVQAILGGILRGDGNVKAFQDTSGTLNAKAFWATGTGNANIRAGTKGLLKVYVTAAQFYAVPCLITKVNVARPVAGAVEYDFDVKLSAESSATTYALPIPA